MDKKTYMQKLEHTMKCYGYTPYEYFYQFGLKIRGYMKYEFEDWELQCPFLTDEDYHKLIYSEEDNILYFFATAMAKTIELNRKNDVLLLPAHNEVPLLMGDGLTRGDIEEVVQDELKDDSLTRGDIEGIINHELESDNLSRNDIEDIINGQFNEESLSRGDIEDVINRQLDSDALSRNDIEGIINHELESENLSRDDIESVINDQLNEDVLSRGDISSIIDETFNKVKVGFFNIGKKLSHFLKSLVVLKQEDHSDLYTYDPMGEGLGEKISSNVHCDSGIYVNYEEYLNHMIDDVFEKYPDANKISFINKESQEMRTFYEVCEEAFQSLRKAGSIRFGEGLDKKQINSYRELINLHLGEDKKYSLRKGVYVRRDLLDQYFSQYSIEVSLKNDDLEKVTNNRK